MSHVYSFKRGDRVRKASGKNAGATGTVDSKVLQRRAHYPEELGAGYHVALDAGKVVTVWVEQVSPLLLQVTLGRDETGDQV